MDFLAVDGVRLAYRIDGPEDAPVLVLLNSVGTNLNMWEPQIPAFSQRFRVVRLDYRGHGSSEVPTEGYSLERYGLDVLHLLDELGIERVNLCGLSLGGIVALWIASQHPERVERAVFANTAAKIGNDDVWDGRIEAVKAGGTSVTVDATLERFLSEPFRRQHPESVALIGEMIEHTDPVGYIGACIALRDADLRPNVPTIRVPSLIIGSELDTSTTPEQALELHEAIPGSQLTIFERTAHLSNIEQADAFSERVLNFLSEQ